MPSLLPSPPCYFSPLPWETPGTQKYTARARGTSTPPENVMAVHKKFPDILRLSSLLTSLASQASTCSQSPEQNNTIPDHHPAGENTPPSEFS